MTDQANHRWKAWVYYTFGVLVAVQAGLVVIPLVLLACMGLEEARLLSLAAVLMLAGCMGAFVNLFGSRYRHRDKRNLFLLLAGLLGACLMLVVDELAVRSDHLFGQWAFFAFPMIHAAVHVGLCALRLTRNQGEYFLKPWEMDARSSGA